MQPVTSRHVQDMDEDLHLVSKHYMAWSTDPRIEANAEKLFYLRACRQQIETSQVLIYFFIYAVHEPIGAPCSKCHIKCMNWSSAITLSKKQGMT